MNFALLMMDWMTHTYTWIKKQVEAKTVALGVEPARSHTSA